MSLRKQQYSNDGNETDTDHKKVLLAFWQQMAIRSFGFAESYSDGRSVCTAGMWDGTMAMLVTG